MLLRQWRTADREPFAVMNGDPAVMEHFPHTLTRTESDAFALRLERGLERDGYGLWALEIPGEAPFAGLVGLMDVEEEMPFAPGVEVGWRLARAHWGRGFAAEAATASIAYGFETLALREIVAFTAVSNERSRRLMERLGMSRNPADDFAHPMLAPAHPLSAHVLYRIKRGHWRASASGREIRSEPR